MLYIFQVLMFCQTILIEWFRRFQRMFVGDNLTRLKKPYWVSPEKGVVLITGTTSGVGKEAALYLAKLGYHVIITARDEKRGQDTLNEIKEKSGNNKVELLELDLCSLESVKKAAQKIIDRQLPIHVLINNAGGMYSKAINTVDGIETTWQTNHVGPFYFTKLLLDNVKKASPPGRITLASNGHWLGTIDSTALQFKAPEFNTGFAYPAVKLANILFARELQRKLQKEGRSDILSVAVHPGSVNTNFGKDMGMKLIFSLSFAQSPASGARTTLYTTLAPTKELVAGAYYHNTTLGATSKEARDEKLAATLWKETETVLKKKTGA